nr:sugar transporter ERD6-like 10 isoform X7 [Nicotiana tomentosiformis]
MDEGLLDRSSPRKASWESHVTANVVLSSSVAACGYFAYGFAVGYASPAQSGIMDDLGLSIAEYSVFASIMTFGGMIGALISGKVADIFGRRVTMWLLDLFFILGWCSIIFGKRAWWLDAGRLLMGVGSGIQLYVAPIYISEVTPKNIRGCFAAAASFTLTLGFSLAYYIGNNMNWRTLALVGASPCFIQVLGVFFIPESPRWLSKIGLEEEVEASLQRLRGGNADISTEAAEIRDYTKTVRQLSGSDFMDLFSRKYARPLIVGTGLMALVQFGGNSGISSFASSIFRAAASICCHEYYPYRKSWTATAYDDYFGWGLLRMLSFSVGVSFKGLSSTGRANLFDGVHWHTALFCIFHNGHGWYTLDYHVRDTNYKHQGFCWEFHCLGQLFYFLDSFLCF